MKTESRAASTAHTPGTLRAAQGIQAAIQKAVNDRGISSALYFADEYFNKDILAEIISRETGDADLLEALEALLDIAPFADDPVSAEIHARASAALAKAQGER